MSGAARELVHYQNMQPNTMNSNKFHFENAINIETKYLFQDNERRKKFLRNSDAHTLIKFGSFSFKSTKCCAQNFNLTKWH